MALASYCHMRHALLAVLCCGCNYSLQQTLANTTRPTWSPGGTPPVTIATPSAGLNTTTTRMPMRFRSDSVLPTVTITTPSAWVNPSASIPTDLGTDNVVVTSASVGGPPQIYLGASIAAKAHEAVQANCSQVNSPNCQSSVGKAVETNNALERRLAPIALILAAAAALLSYVISHTQAEDVNSQPQLVNFQPDGYTQMIAAQYSSAVVFVTASDDPSPVTVPLITTSSGIASITPTDSVIISTATANGPGYLSGDSFIKIPTVDVAPLATILTATQSGALCAAPSVQIKNPLQNRGSGDTLINWGSAVGSTGELLPGLAAGGALQLLATARNIQLPQLAPALVQAAQQVVALGKQITNLLFSSPEWIAIAAVLLIITIVIQNCLPAFGNAFLIPREAFSQTLTQSSNQTSTSSASCAPSEYQPFCINCINGNAKCSSNCPCYQDSVYKYDPDLQQIALAAAAASPDGNATYQTISGNSSTTQVPAPTSSLPPQATPQIPSGNITCETTTRSPLTEDVNEVIIELVGKGTDWCQQTTGGGNDCTTKASYGTAAIAVCGAQGWTTHCYQAAQWAQDIQSACLSHGRVGGKNVFEVYYKEHKYEVSIEVITAVMPNPKPLGPGPNPN